LEDFVQNIPSNILNIGDEKFGSLVITKEGDILEVRLPRFFRDRNWANSLGYYQKELLDFSESHGTPRGMVVFNLTSCRWIDPLPLMSVLLEIVFAHELGFNIDICFPEPDASLSPTEKGFYHKSANRFLRFLAHEGFLDSLDELATKDEGIRFISNKPWDCFRDLPVRPSYEDAMCVPMRIFNVPAEGEEFAKNTVDDLMKGVDSRLEAKIAPQTRERLISRLRVALQEVLHNTQEHAYNPSSIYRPLVIYVRYRSGGVGRDSAGKQVFLDSIKEEKKHCPRLQAEWLTDRTGCLEFFVLDRGVGMVGSFERASIPLTYKHKFHEVIQKTFYDGRSTKPERWTRYGGLHLLNNLLNGDYLRGLEGNLWVGCGIPLQREKEGIYNLTNYAIQGLAMHFRLGWKVETDQGDEWAKFKQGEKCEIWQELRLSENDCALSFDWFKRKIVIDERFGFINKNGDEGDWILWLVQPHRMKWDILNFIEHTIAPDASNGTVLIVADIPSYEAKIYEAALGGFKITGRDKPQWPSKFSRIILVTNRWRFAVVDYEVNGDQYGFSELCSNFSTLRVQPPPIYPIPQNFRLSIVRWVKWHDSRLVWDEVKRGRTMFIPEKVTWGNDKTEETKYIAGYLDFPQTTHNEMCSDVYRSALARILGILPSHRFSIHPLDRLTMTVLQEIFADEIYEPATAPPEKRLALGSVLVSGTTLDASISRSLDLHFFIHCESPLQGKKPALLYWLFPHDQIKDTSPKLTRIGRTASVAPEGWKSFEVPRYDAIGKCVGARDPHATYQDWQNPSPVIVKAGHWMYEGHHDFITVNLASAVEAAFLAKNELARFLVNGILPFIGLTKEHVDESWHRLLEEQLTKGNISTNRQSDHGLLVYRSHPNSDSVVRRLLSLLTIKGRELALERIFSILPVRMRWGNSTLLIPPLVREEIRKTIFGGKQARPILLFDDAAVTGRTLLDIRTALSSIGATEIFTMVIVNRLRQPADGYGKEQIGYYWRLDVPVIGREGNCPLCHALHLTEAFASSLAATNAKQEIMDWNRRWGARSPMYNWSGGIHPLPLKTPERRTKYCYRLKDGDHLSEIDLIRSTGLIIHVSELHAMTGRDDYCLKKIREHDEPEIRVELAASQLMLFGNEFDMDVRVELIRTLIRELTKLKGDSPHASLSALAVISGLGFLDQELKFQVAKTIHEGGLKLKSNYVTKVLLAYLAFEKLLDKESYAFKLGKKMLSTVTWPLAERLNAMFLETLSIQGNAHSEDIPLLIGELSKSSVIDVMLIRGAMDSLDHIGDIIEGLDGIARKDAKSEYKINVEILKKLCESVKELLASRPAKDTEWRINTERCLKDYIMVMKKVADAYFHRIPSATDYWRNTSFSETIMQIIKQINWEKASNKKGVERRDRQIKISTAGQYNFDPSAGEVWVCWIHGIPGIVKDLCRNAVYADKQCKDPWSSAQMDESADLWIRIDFEKEGMNVILANSVNGNTSQIFQKLKYRWSYLENIGGGIVQEEVSDSVFAVQVRIPYAGHLHAGS